MHTVPIDYDHEMYARAREIAGGSDERLFEDYFDAQLDMLRALKPPVVGHFDLIRLKSDDPERSFKTWPGVWSRILRNLDFVVEYGGLVEVNGAALRKGMSEPYPKAEICEVCLMSWFLPWCCRSFFFLRLLFFIPLEMLIPSLGTHGSGRTLLPLG